MIALHSQQTGAALSTSRKNLQADLSTCREEIEANVERDERAVALLVEKEDKLKQNVAKAKETIDNRDVEKLDEEIAAKEDELARNQDNVAQLEKMWGSDPSRMEEFQHKALEFHGQKAAALEHALQDLEAQREAALKEEAAAQTILAAAGDVTGAQRTMEAATQKRDQSQSISERFQYYSAVVGLGPDGLWDFLQRVGDGNLALLDQICEEQQQDKE
jgi:hypothetical protein